MPNNGTLVGAPTFATASTISNTNSAGNFGQAVTFNGSTQYITIPSSTFQFAGGVGTAEFRVRTTSAAAGPVVILGFASTGTSTPGSWWAGLASGVLKVSIQGFNAATTFGTATINDGNWHHVAVVMTGGIATIYVDGVAAGSQTGTLVAPTGSFYSSLGALTSTGSAYNFDFAGSVDEVAIWTTARYTTTFTPTTTPYGNGTANLFAIYHLDGDATDGNLPLVTAGNLQLNSATQTAISLTVLYANGTFPFTFVWQRATVTGGVIGSYSTLSNGSGVTGATTATLVDASTGLVVSTLYAYKCTVTDSTITTFTTFSRFVRLGLAPIILVAIGDSTSAGIGGTSANTTVTQASVGQFPIANAALYLQTAKGYRNVTPYNASVSGSASGTWTNTTGGSNFANALALAGGTFAGMYVFVRLGVNDAQGSVAAATFNTNVSTLLANIIANGGKVILSYPMQREPGLYGQDGVTNFTEATTPLLLSYLSYLDAMVNNTTVFAGDKNSLYASLANPQLYFYYLPGTVSSTPGAIHENAIGAMMMGTNEAQALLNVLYPTTSAFRPVKGGPVHK